MLESFRIGAVKYGHESRGTQIPRKCLLARYSSNYKLPTHSLVREGDRNKNTAMSEDNLYGGGYRYYDNIESACVRRETQAGHLFFFGSSEKVPPEDGDRMEDGYCPELRQIQ
jgi:hypothetical protein